MLLRIFNVCLIIYILSLVPMLVVPIDLFFWLFYALFIAFYIFAVYRDGYFDNCGAYKAILGLIYLAAAVFNIWVFTMLCTGGF